MRVRVVAAMLGAGIAATTALVPTVGAQAARADTAGLSATAALRATVDLLGRGRIVQADGGARVVRFAPWRAGSTDPVVALLQGVPAAAPDARLFRANWSPGWWAGTTGLALTVAGAYSAGRLSDGAAVSLSASGIGLGTYGLVRELRGRRALSRAVGYYNASRRR